MALLLCRECGKEISDSAKKCENCGAHIYIALGTSTKIRIKYNLLVWLLIALGATFIFSRVYIIGILFIVIGLYIAIWFYKFPKRI